MSNEKPALAKEDLVKRAAFEKLLPYMEDRPEVSLDDAIRCLEQVEGKETAEAVLRVIDSRSRRRADLRGS